jgi:hypothetical protein
MVRKKNVILFIYLFFPNFILDFRDRRKLTFYFNAEKRIDFRELVRELFKIYKTRIWM